MANTLMFDASVECIGSCPPAQFEIYQFQQFQVLKSLKKCGVVLIFVPRWDRPNTPNATWDKISYCLINEDLC